MNLKRIEVLGFKSFADKVVIDLTEGFTCFVGPNGCGKSNVADSIRWALGEQSARTLRGKKMSDVIFHGTNRRKPVSYCEVTLVFDNTSHHYPIDYDELCITRKLYRNGESEYLINKTPRKLKEIVELFKDTGIGREGYSIIGQGAISNIISTRPDDRRHIFEEAAGITKHRDKRNEAEKRLSNARINLESAEFKKNLLESDLGPLGKEAADAEKAKEIKTSLMNLEINSYLFQNENNAAKKQNLQKDLDSVSARADEVVAKIAEKQTEYNAILDEDERFTKQLQELNDRKLAITLAQEKRRSAHQTADTLASELSKKEMEYTASRDSKTRDLERDKAELLDQKKKKDDTLSELVSLQKTESVMKVELDALNEKINNKAREIEQLNSFMLSNATQKGDLKAEQAKLQVKLINLTETLEQDKELQKDLKASLSAAKKALDDNYAQLEKTTEEKKQKTVQRREVEAKHADLLADKDRLEDTLDRIKNTLGNLTGEIRTTERMLRDNSQYAPGVRNLLNSTDRDVKDCIVSLVCDAITVPSNLQFAIEVALGRSAQFIITENNDDTDYLVDYLKRNKLGRATFMSKTNVLPRELRREYAEVLEEEGCLGKASDLIRYDRSLKNIMSNLLGSVVIVEDMATGRRLSAKYGKSFRIVSLEGDDFAPGGSVTGGANANTDGLLSSERVLKDKKRQLEQNEKQKETILEQLGKCDEDLKKLERIAGLLMADTQKLEKDEVQLSERISNIEADIGKNSAAVEKLTEEIKTLTKEKTDTELLCNAAGGNMNESESQKMSADELLGRSRMEQMENMKIAAVKTDEYKIVTDKITTATATLGSVTGSINGLESDMKRLSFDLTDLEAKLKTNAVALARAQEELATSALTDEEKEESTKIMAEFAVMNEKRAKYKERQSTVYNEKEALTKLSYDLQNKRIALENHINSIDVDTEALAAKIREDYGIGYDETLKYKTNDFDEEAAQGEIKKFRRDLVKLGDVRESSIDQYASKKEEFDKLARDYDDVLNSVNAIQAEIDDITKEMELKFSESFGKIQENFKEVFAEMFDGGNGVLSLDKLPTESVLEAGIEIFAEPPGKKIKQISLLSGGEQTLTAIAILFSIIKIKPMPFCVLDEIEAALDDANAYRVAKFLKKYCRLTQFLVISHKKPTMELADVLFGITMEELGVSQVVSVKLSDALKHAVSDDHKVEADAVGV